VFSATLRRMKIHNLVSLEAVWKLQFAPQARGEGSQMCNVWSRRTTPAGALKTRTAAFGPRLQRGQRGSCLVSRRCHVWLPSAGRFAAKYNFQTVS
jgi:hypothetical protein